MSSPWHKDIVLDPHTFGGTPACEILVEMINNNAIPI